MRARSRRMEAALLTDGDEIRVGPFRICFSAGPTTAARPALPHPSRRRTMPAAGEDRSPGRGTKARASILVAGAAGLALFAVVVTGLAFFTGPGKAPGGAPAPPSGPHEAASAEPLLPDEPLPPVAPWPPPPDAAVRAEVDRASASLQTALAAGNLEEAFVHVHPAATAELRAAFEPHRSELPRVARLLATRRLVVAEETWAEYEVNEDGRTYAVVFEKVEGRWLLSSL